MPQRHSKNNNDLAFFTYEEKRKLGYGTQRQRLGKDSIKPFDCCAICLKLAVEPLSCRNGHLFCKECIFECLLAQKKDIKRNLINYAAQQNEDAEEEQRKKQMQREQELSAFERQNNSAVPCNVGKAAVSDEQSNGFQGANSVRVTSYEEEALRTMKAFWLPSATPEAPVRVQTPNMDTICPEGKEKLKLKDLFPVIFTETPNEKEGDVSEAQFICPWCTVTLTNTTTLVVISTCGHVLCKKCSDRFLLKDKICTVCNRPCKPKHIVSLEKGGTGFSGHGDALDANVFKHVGSGTGLGLMQPSNRI